MDEQNNGSRFGEVLGLFGLTPEKAKARVEATDAETAVRIWADLRWALKVRSDLTVADVDKLIEQAMSKAELLIKNPQTRQEVVNQFLIMRNRAAGFLGVQPDMPDDTIPPCPT